MLRTPSAVIVRRAVTGDLSSVRHCLLEAFEAYRADYTPEMFDDTVPGLDGLEARSREMTIWIASASDGSAVGTIAAGVRTARVGHLRGMAVLPASHGSGVADQLLRTAEAELRRLGCVTVSLDTTARLERAMAFYERHGYRRSGMRHQRLGMELIEFRKDL